MKSLRDDPMHNAVQEGIKEDIEVVLANNRFRAAVLLIYAGIDSMAALDMPEGQHEGARTDFIRWTDRYIRFLCKQQLTGEELYGARCGLLHSYQIESRRSREGKCRMIGYVDQAVPEIRYDPKISTELVIVSIRGLKDAFFSGINQFLINSLLDKTKAKIVQERLEKMIGMFPIRNRD